MLSLSLSLARSLALIAYLTSHSHGGWIVALTKFRGTVKLVPSAIAAASPSRGQYFIRFEEYEVVRGQDDVEVPSSYTCWSPSVDLVLGTLDTPFPAIASHIRLERLKPFTLDTSI
jgi:hypothetical protein